MKTTITVPNEFLLATRMTTEEIQLELAISLFQQEKTLLWESA